MIFLVESIFNLLKHGDNLIFFVSHWYCLFSDVFTSICLSCGLHHGSDNRKIFCLTWIFQGSNYLSPYGYGVMHRMHHAFADTENDPHSPKYDETIFNMMWKTKTIYSKIASGKEIPEKRFTNGVPRWDFFDRFARSWPSRLSWGFLCGILLFLGNRLGLLQ